MPARALFLTGAPGVGKTTAIWEIAARLPAGSVGGFLTEEVREAGRRKGFRLVPFDGEPRLLAHVDFRSRHRVGKYGVDVAMLEELAPALLASGSEAHLHVIDEIGKMECFSARFVAGVRALLDAGRPLLASVAKRGGGFIAEVKERPDVEIWEITRANRDELPERAAKWLREKGVQI